MLGLKRGGREGSYGSFSSLAAVSSGRSESGLLRYATIPVLTALSMLLLFLFVMIGFVSVRLSKEQNCLGPPYLYVSSTNQKNIRSLTRDGCPVKSAVLWEPELHGQARNMRAMAMGHHLNKSAMFVANAASDESSVLVFKECMYWNGMRPFETKVLSSAPGSLFRDGAQHAYGVAFDKDGNIYVSYERTNVILRAARDTYTPMPLPQFPFIRYRSSSPSSSTTTSTDEGGSLGGGKEATARRYRRRRLRAHLRQRRLEDVSAGTGPEAEAETEAETETEAESEAEEQQELQRLRRRHYYSAAYEPQLARKNSSSPSPAVGLAPFPGTFVQFEAPYLRPNDTDTGIRAIVWAGDHLWIANEDDKAVFIVAESGRLVATLPVASPIGMYYDSQLGLVFVGSKSKHNGGVSAFDATTFSLVRSFVLMSLRHPVGIVSFDDTLFVADQSINGIVTFKVSTGRYLSTISFASSSASSSPSSSAPPEPAADPKGGSSSSPKAKGELKGDIEHLLLSFC